MLELLLLLLQDSRGFSPPPPTTSSSIRRPWSSVRPTSVIRSGEKTVDAPGGSSRSTKLSASSPREGVTREEEEEGGEEEEKGGGSGGGGRV